MRDTKKILELLTERFPIPEDCEGNHSVVLTGENKELAIQIWHRNSKNETVVRPAIFDDADLDLSPEEIVQAISELIETENAKEIEEENEEKRAAWVVNYVRGESRTPIGYTFTFSNATKIARNWIASRGNCFNQAGIYTWIGIGGASVEINAITVEE